MNTTAQTIIDSPRFKALTARKARVSATLTAVMLAAYFGFILALAFGKPLLSRMLTEGVSLGLPVGLSLIALAWGLTGVYVRWANTSHDAAMAELRDEIEAEGRGETR